MTAYDFVYRGKVTLDTAALDQMGNQFGTLEKRGTRSMNKMSKNSRMQIRQMGFAMQRFGIHGAAAWGEMFGAAGAAGVAIGVVVVSILALVKILKTVYTLGKAAFMAIAKPGIEAAKGFELAGAQFKAVMKGNEEAAEATLERVKKLSREVGENLTEVARAFLPEVADLDQLEDILKIATALARYQPEQGIMGARISLQEFLAGQTRSLERRFEIPHTDIERMKEAFETYGITGAIDELNKFLERTGRSLEALSDTAQVAFNKMQEGFRQVAAEFGEPILESAKDQFNEVNDRLEDLTPVLNTISRAFGEITARVVDFVGQEVQAFIESIDFDNIINLAIAFHGAADAALVMFGRIDAGDEGGAAFNNFVYALIDGLMQLEEWFLNNAVAIHNMRLELNDMYQMQSKVTMNLVTFSEAADWLAGDIPVFDEATDALSFFANFTQDIAEGLQVDTESTEELNAAFVDFYVRKAKFIAQMAEYRAEQELSNAAGREAAEVILSEEDALKSLEEKLKQIAESEKEVAEARDKFQTQAADRFAAIVQKFDRANLDAMIDNARRFSKIQEDMLDKFEDLRTDYNRKIEANELDLTQAEEDILRKHGRKTIDIEKDLNSDRLDIEKEFRRRLEEIRRRFAFDANEAIRQNDALEYLRLKRRMQFELDEAKIQRDEDVQDAEGKAEEKRQSLVDSLNNEIEDAKIAYRRKIDDINTWLAEQTSDINLWAEREREASLERLAQARQDNITAKDRQLEDYNKWWVDHFNSTEEGIADHLTQLEEWRNSVNTILSQFPNIVNVLFGTTGREGAGFAPRGGARGTRHTGAASTAYEGPTRLQEVRSDIIHTAGLVGLDMATVLETIREMDLQELEDYLEQISTTGGGRQKGGPVRGGEMVLVGEPLPGGKPNPEYFVPAQDGYIIPVKRLSDATGQTPSDVIKTITKMMAGDDKQDINLFSRKFDVPARQMGGPVRQGSMVSVGEPLSGNRPNPEIYVPAGMDFLSQRAIVSALDASKAISRAMAMAKGTKTAAVTRELEEAEPSELINMLEPQSAGEPVMLGAPSVDVSSNFEYFVPEKDGVIIPLRQIAEDLNKPLGQVVKEVAQMMQGKPRDATESITKYIQPEGRQHGGPVTAGEIFRVAEPASDGSPNPELYLPSTSKRRFIADISELLGPREMQNALKRKLLALGKKYQQAQRKRGQPTRSARSRQFPGPIPSAETGGSTSPQLAYGEEASALRQMYFSPPFLQDRYSSTQYDQRRSVHIHQPITDPGLSPIEVAQIKDIYTQMRLEEQI